MLFQRGQPRRLITPWCGGPKWVNTRNISNPREITWKKYTKTKYGRHESTTNCLQLWTCSVVLFCWFKCEFFKTFHVYSARHRWIFLLNLGWEPLRMENHQNHCLNGKYSSIDHGEISKVALGCYWSYTVLLSGHHHLSLNMAGFRRLTNIWRLVWLQTDLTCQCLVSV